ncbi:MAG: zinc-dependent metalloprotease [Burkholderiaceae bacterium]|nr:zinc-dependent metalloprotease [Burkholderiaceae bacterium]
MSFLSCPAPVRRATAVAAFLCLGGCAQLGTVQAPGAQAATPTAAPSAAPAPAGSPAAAPRPPGAPPAAAPAPGQPPPFATVIKDAKPTHGLFSVWQKDEKVWIELKPDDFDKPFFLSPKLRTGIGEARVFGGLMVGAPALVEFRRQHNVVQLVAINQQQVAQAGTPEARAVAAAVSPSLLTAYPVGSQPHPDRKAVLVDLSAMLMNDMLGIGGHLQRTYRQNYAFDARNSAVVGVRGQPGLLVLETNNHFATANIAVPQPGAPPGAPVPTVPGGLPDARSLFVGLHFSLMQLPATPMARRAADPRVGYFQSARDDYSDDLARSPRQRVVNRWRLEKKDPAAALSEPVKPITYWLDRNIPVKYRAAITAGVLEWNKAFERIGFQNAIVVQQQPDDATWDTLDAGVASLRWMTNRQPAFGAIGPSHVDPRSGEILDADIGIESLSARNLRNLRARVLGGTATAAAAQDWAELLQVAGPPAPELLAGGLAHDPLQCRHADHAAEQLGYALDVLAARGDLDPDSPEARQFVLDYMKDMTMHEVGHTLGLRHNFRASHGVRASQVADPEFTRREAFTNSVMEYAPVNLPRPGEPAAAPFQATLGTYDYWAIEYGYKPIPAEQEREELARIAARSGEPALGYGTDEDNFLGIDPDALHFDLGDDVLAFASRRFDIARDLFQRQETRTLKPDEDYGILRRTLGYAVRDAGRAAGVLLRQVGGVRTLRDFPNTGRDPLQPLPAADQRAALQMLSQRVLAADAFVVSPALQRKLAPNFLERGESLAEPTEYPLGQTVLDLQRAILNRLMGDSLATRVLDTESKVSPPAQPLRLAELYDQLEADVWSELAGSGDIPQPRRELQREHVSRMAALVLRPGLMTRSDARAMVRSRGAALAQRLERAAGRKGLSGEARAHLADSAEALRSALAATQQRAGV